MIGLLPEVTPPREVAEIDYGRLGPWFDPLSQRRRVVNGFLCMLAYYMRWHMERAWAPLLFRDEERPVLVDPVAPAQRSRAALRKASTQELEDGAPVHSFRTLLKELATLTRNRIRLADREATFDVWPAPPSCSTARSRCFSSCPPRCSQNRAPASRSVELARSLKLQSLRRRRLPRSEHEQGRAGLAGP